MASKDKVSYSQRETARRRDKALVSVQKEVDSKESVVILYGPPIRFSGGGRCGRMRTEVSTSARERAIRVT